MKGIIETLPNDKFDLRIFFLDSKRQTSPELNSRRIDSIRWLINKLKPKVLIVSDDYAIKYLIEPYFNHLNLPIVFCGLNWSASHYNLSLSHITGMLEVLPLRESIQFLKNIYPHIKTIAIVSENSLSEQNNTEILDTLYRNMGLEPFYYLVDDFYNWQQSFIDANMRHDLIYLPTNGAIKGWIDDEAILFVNKNIKKPVFTCDDFMMPFSVLGFTKVPEEQGIWAANVSKQIINGIKPSDIQITRNSQSITWFNKCLANKIGFNPDKEFLNDAKMVVMETK